MPYESSLLKRRFTRADSRRKNRSVRKPKPGLAIDTTFTRHRSQIPIQIFPSTIRPQAIATPSEEQETPRPDQSAWKYQSVGKGLVNGVGFVRPTSLVQSRPFQSTASADLSPSNCIIPIGLVIPAGGNRATPNLISNSTLYHGVESTTPTIIITPAHENFNHDFGPQIFDKQVARPPSSVYSRYTHHQVNHAEQTPPIPTLQFMAAKKLRRESSTTVFEDDDEVFTVERRKGPDSSIERTPLSHVDGYSRGTQLFTPPVVPTPRRSKGWWNFITSPFSAPKGSPGWWRSPSIRGRDDHDALPILSEACEPGVDDRLENPVGVKTQSREDDEMRTAPADGNTPVTVLRRSNTVPSRLTSVSSRFDIYQIPRFGEAAAYYDPCRRFPSVVISPDDVARDVPPGWSPSHSVAHSGRCVSTFKNGTPCVFASLVFESPECQTSETSSVSPLCNAPKFEDVRRRATVEHPTLTSPTENELFSIKSTRNTHLTSRNRRSTHVTIIESYFSPLTATPTIQSAFVENYQHITGTPREIQISPARPEMVDRKHQTKHPAKDAVNETESFEEVDHSEKLPQQRTVTRPGFNRNNSFGLGIVDADSGKSLFPAPTVYGGKHVHKRIQSTCTAASDEKQKAGVPWYKRFLWFILTGAIAAAVLLVVLLVIFVPQGHKDTPIQAQWLNVTGFPALPSGVTTVVQPHLGHDVGECMTLKALWTCNNPQALQGRDSAARNSPDFRFEIQKKDGHESRKRSSIHPSGSGFAVRARTLARRDTWAASLFTPRPSAPSTDDDLFLGETTDNITAPFDGIETPFVISLLNPIDLTSKNDGHSANKRDDTSESSSSMNPYPYPTAESSMRPAKANLQAPLYIPELVTQSNGKPSPAVLYTYVDAQPLRLYNRGQESEHYGFYNYFDRTTIYTNLNNTSSTAKSAICTWSQTRLHVQIWTRRPAIGNLSESSHTVKAINSTANDFSGGGSFPLRVTISIDRHGGASDQKGVYCYGLDDDGIVIKSAKTWVAETRDWGGTLINPAKIPGVVGDRNSTSVSSDAPQRRDEKLQSGIDGGTGGCRCSWNNF